MQGRSIDRPFLTKPIRRPVKIDKKMERHSARDAETLIKVELHMSTIICADYKNPPAVPKNMINFTNSEMRINQAFCKAYSGRLLRHNTVIKPACHFISWVDVRNPNQTHFSPNFSPNMCTLDFFATPLLQAVEKKWN